MINNDQPPPSIGATIEVAARSIDESGLGVGEVRGLEIRAANVLPGERVSVVIEHVSPHRPVAWGRAVRRMSRVAPERVTPTCPSF
ncbi:MAG: 23S rRNA (uracil(1939)-C(5))-methyltransferase RlmD, partial [Myxococcota bacterium]